MSRRLPLGQSLKQKLSALSLAPPSPTSPTSPGSNSNADWSPSTAWPSSLAKKKSSLFSWGRKDDSQVEDELPPTQQDIEQVEAVLDKVICQAGVDYETRPMVVITAAALPDPRTISYDLLLTRILAHLDVYVENDYTVVFLTAGGRHTPGWNWVWKAYRSLNRKYRKNLKKMFIVHSTWFSKMLFSLAGAIISPKFFRKIQYVATLSELAENVPLTQIDIAPAVYQENLRYERQITLPDAHHAGIFGVPLETLMGEYGENGGLPRVVKDCVEYIRECGMEVEGIFRRSPNSALLRQAKEAYDRGHPVSLSAFSDPHIAAVLLKKFFRDLPEPMFHEEMYPVIRRCPMSTGSGDLETVTYIREQILPLLRSDAAEIVLSYVFNLLHDISLRSSVNLMDAHNLALCFTPTLVGSSLVHDVQMCSIPGGPSLFSAPVRAPSPTRHNQTTVAMIVKFCIQRYFEIFEEVIDRSEPLHSPDSILAQGDYAGTRSPRGHGMDEEESLDDAMLVMPLGPTSPTTSSPYSNLGIARSPPTAWKHKHRRMGSGTSNTSASQAAPSTPGSTRSHKTRESIGGAMTGSRRRSVISLEKAMAKNGSRGSITIGKGTARRPGGAGVEAVNVTALGFFMPPSEDSSPVTDTSSTQGGSSTGYTSGDGTDGGNAVKSRAATRQELSEVTE